MRVPWTARRSSQSILKEISPGCFLEGMMLKLKLQYFGHLMQRVDSLEKTLMLGGIGDRRKRGQLLKSSSSSQGINLKRWTMLARKMRQPLSFLGLPIYFKFKIICYTFTKTLGQRFDIFSSPSPRFIISINHCCSSNRVPASVILSESALPSIIYFLLCVL